MKINWTSYTTYITELDYTVPTSTDTFLLFLYSIQNCQPNCNKFHFITGNSQQSPSQQRGSNSSNNNSNSSSNNKYLRSHLFTNQGATTLPTNRPNTSKVRVLSILDKIRANSQENYASRPVNSTPQSIPNNSNREALIDAISLVEDNG